MRNHPIIVIVATIAAAASSHAQQPPAAQDPLSGQASLGYLATSGNAQSTNASAGFGLVYLRGNWAHDFDLAAVAATSNEVRTAEAYSAKYESRRALGERAYLFTAVDWGQDLFSAYDRQLSESVGYGRRLIVRERHALNGDLGIGARQAELRDGPEQDEAIARAGLDYTWVFTEMTGLTQDLVIESGSDNTRVEAITAVRARLVGNIGLVFSYRIKRNSAVPAGVEDTDRFTSIALEYAF